MSKPWKAFERASATLLTGKRYWANSGESVDVESSFLVAQCKHVRVLSLAALEALALEAERQGSQRQKLGLVCVKRRAGHGRATPTLVVMTAATFRELHGSLPGDDPPDA
jgi:hypothetical protein